MFDENFFKDFDEQLEFRKLEHYWDYKNRKHVRVTYFLSREKILISYNIKFIDEDIIVSSDTFYEHLVGFKQIILHYGKKMVEFLKHHPKLRIRFVSTNMDINLDKTFTPYLDKRRFPIKEWAKAGFKWTSWVVSLFFVIHIVGMTTLLVMGESKDGILVSILFFANLFVTLSVYFVLTWVTKCRFEKKYPLKL